MNTMRAGERSTSGMSFREDIVHAMDDGRRT
jgi:hypothetical protein